MDFSRMLLRMAQWVRHPPSPRTVKIALVVIALAMVIYGIELAGLWPEWANVQGAKRPQIRVN